MKVRHMAHRKSSMVGKVEEVPTDFGERLVASGFAVRVDEDATVDVPGGDDDVAPVPATDAASTDPKRVGRRRPARPVDAGAAQPVPAAPED
ncbi:hypothetical protein [Rhodococcus pyridinivorans]|uniref:Uncharacterized protein n=1 Tax=Rhodococcus pyridinivorans TaxID=103816 RepID=A0A7M2XRI5_9NOCA|nr:hypothetical protein [Rhodococcus pyridinivorans]QOV99511.1 hypothetical protein INP59_03670 [Rhodococcus pyridinivorans]